MSHESRTSPPTYPEVLDIHDGAFSESIWGSDGFRTIKVSGQDDVIADSYKDNLTISAGTNVTLTTNAAGDTLTIAATPGVVYTGGTGIDVTGTTISVTSLAVTNVHEAANQTAQLALTTQEGDVVVRTDENKSYVKNAGTAGSMSDFTLLRTPTDVVLSVAGNTGAITAAQLKTAYESNAETNAFTDALKSKLEGIEDNATADQTQAEIEDIVGAMLDGTETGISVSYDATDNNLDFVVATQTANDFTNTLKNKLDGIETDATADQTNAEIRAAVEAATDSNVFTDTDHSKLNAIESLADVTDTANVDAAGAVMNSDLDVKGELLVGDGSGDPQALSVGTNGYILKADSSTDTGLVWAAAGAGGENNQNAFSTVAVSGQDNVAADTTTDTLTLAAGTNITLTTTAASDTVTIGVTSTADATKMPLAGGTFTGDITINDNEEIRVGTGNDLVIVHNGTDSFIKETTGILDIRAKNTNGGIISISDSAGENLIKATAGSSVELTYDGTKKFETTSAGATVTGTLTATLADNSIAKAQVADDAIGIDELSATGTASSSTYLRGDNTWATVSSGGVSSDGAYNTIGGGSAGSALDGDSTKNTFFGYYAGNVCNDGDSNVCIGHQAGDHITSGSESIAIGDNALTAISTVGKHVAIGHEALKGLTSAGAGNVAIGWKAMNLNQTGGYSVAIGYQALNSATGQNNTAIGYDCGLANTGNNNTFLGASCAKDHTGTNCIVIGSQANPSGNSATNEITLGHTDVTKFRIPGINFVIKDTTATDNYVLTVDSNGEAGWEAAAAGGIPDAGNTVTGGFALDRSTTIKIDAGQYLWLTCDQYLDVDVGQYADIDITQNLQLDVSQYIDINTSQYFDLSATQYIALGTAGTERFRITSTGALAIEGSTNYGSSGQVLTSNGNDAPTWQTASGGGPGTGESYVKLDTGGSLSNSGSNTYAGHDAGDSLGANSQNNTFFGKEAGKNVDSEGNHTAIGERALSSATSASSNTAVGQVAMRDTTTGSSNVAVGNNTLLVNATGSYNTAIGTYCLDALDDVSYNTGVGWHAGGSLTTATDCTFVGREAGKGVTTGSYNLSIGAESMLGAVTGTANVNVGRDGLRAITSGQKNVNVGNDGNRTGTTASYCVSVGHESLFNNTANANIAVGYNALKANTSGGSNTAIGFQSLWSCTTSSHNTAIGYDALLYATGSNNVGVGTRVMDAGSCTATHCTAVGDEALTALTSGSSNTAIGNSALGTCTTGTNNVAVGQSSLYGVTTGGYNVAVGRGAGDSITTASNCVAIGYAALQAHVDGLRATAVGANSASQNTASYTTAVGYNACQSNTSGARNIAMGYAALQENSTNSDSAAFGHAALTLSTGGQNTALGSKAGDSISTGSNLTCVGFEADASANSATNEITLGNSSVATLRCQVTSISSLSDKRDKTDINTLDLGLDFINELKPVKFKWQSREGLAKDGTYEAGFIAQDFQQVQKDNDADYLQMVLESNPDKLEAAPGKLIPILVRAVQELSAELNTLKNTLNNG